MSAAKHRGFWPPSSFSVRQLSCLRLRNLYLQALLLEPLLRVLLRTGHLIRRATSMFQMWVAQR